MAKALKVIGTVAVIAGLAVVTGGAALGLGVALSTAAFGISAGALIAAGTVLSTAGSLLSPKPKAPATSASNADRLSVSIETRTPRKIILGSTAMATDLRDQEWAADQSYIDRFIVCASHRVQAIREIWFDDVLAWSSTGGVAAKYAGYLSVAPVLEGSPDNAIVTSARMGATRRYTGCAYVWLRYKLTGNSKKTESPFASAVPTRVTIVGDGALFYDPRRDSTVPGGSGTMRAADQSTWSWDASACRNPALALLFYLLGWRIRNPATGAMKLAVGKGLPAARIDLASFITAANICDEPVTRQDGASEPRYRCDGIFSEADDPRLVLDNLKATMNAVLDDVDGRIRLNVLYNDLATPVGDLVSGDVLGEFTWLQTPPLTDSVNVIRGGYIDPSPASLYQMVDFPEVRIESPDGIDRPQTVNLPLVQSGSQAQRLVRLRLARALYAGQFTAVFQATAWKFQKGDVVRFSFYPLGWDRKLFRIADMAIQVDGTVPMMLREENAAIYAAYDNERAVIVGAQPTTYDPTLWPIVQGIVDAGKTAEWPSIDDPAGTKPDDNATNSADPVSPFGPDGTVGGTIVRLGDFDRALAAAKARQDALENDTIPAINAAIGNARDLLDAEAARALGAEEQLSERISNVVADGGGYDDAAIYARVDRVDQARADDRRALGQQIDSLSARAGSGFVIISRGAAAPLAPGDRDSGVYNAAGTRIVGAGPMYTVAYWDSLNRAVDGRIFDTLSGAAEVQRMVDYLNTIPAGLAVTVHTYNEPSAGRTAALIAAMERCGAGAGFRAIEYRSAYVLIGCAGVGRGGGREILRGGPADEAGALIVEPLSLVNGLPAISGIGSIVDASAREVSRAFAAADLAIADRVEAIDAQILGPNGSKLLARAEDRATVIADSKAGIVAQSVQTLQGEYDGTKLEVSRQAGIIADKLGQNVAYFRTSVAAGSAIADMTAYADGATGVSAFRFKAGQFLFEGDVIVDGSFYPRKFNAASMAREGSSVWTGLITPASGQTVSVPWSLSLPSIPPQGRFIYEYTYRLDTNAGTTANGGLDSRGRPITIHYVEDGGGLFLQATDGQGNQYRPRPNASDRVLATTDLAPTFTAFVRMGSRNETVDDGDNVQRFVAASFTLTRIDLKVTWVAI